MNEDTFKAMESTYPFDGNYLRQDFDSLIPICRRVGKYEELRYNYLREYKKVLFSELFYQDKLNDHLAAVEQSARNRLDQIIRCLLVNHPAPDQKTKPMEWVRHMNNLKIRANEIVVQELIYN